MALYSGINSPCCNKEFIGEDDIVVCPECGTPHHRACWFEKGYCFNKPKHESDFIWRSPVENAIKSYIAAEEIERKRLEEREKSAEKDSQLKEFLEELDRVGFPRDKFEELEQKFDERDIYGVSEREIISFQGNNNPLLLARYRTLVESKNKVSLNLFAGFLSPFYQFYNRHRPAGIILCILSFFISTPSLIAHLSQFPQFSNLSSTVITQASGFFSTLNLILMMLCCLFYDYIYLRWMAKRIIGIREKYGDNNLNQQYYNDLAATGKPSFLKMILDFSLVFVFALLLFISIVYLNIPEVPQ